MKKYCKFIIFCVLIFSLIFLSCNNILLSKGSSLSIRLPGTEQSRFAFVKPENLDSFTIILTKKNGKTQEKTAKAGETIVFDSLTADTYTVSAKAFDKDNNCAAYAQEEVLIKPKQNTNLVLNLTWNLLTQAAIDNKDVEFVVTPPKKTTYTLGEDFDPTGLKVEAVFKNGYRQEIPALIQSDTGETSQPIYYDFEPGLENQKQITVDTSYEIYVITDESLSGSFISCPAGFIPLTLNVPKPTILQGPTIDNNSNTSNNGKTATLVLETTEREDFDRLGYIQEFQWYRVENGEAKKLEDNSSPDIPEYPYYRGTTEQILIITFDFNDTNTYQYYVEVTNSIPEDYTNQPLPGITYGKTTATTKSKIVTVTTNGSSSGSGTTTTPTASYSIGDVYPQNGTPMGVVFEVDADNSYIKIVALKDLSSDDGTTAIFKLADPGWIDNATYPVAYNAEDGSINSEGFLDFVDSLEGENFDYTTDLPAFNLTWNYYVENAEDPQATAGTFTWYIPAINELETIVKDTTGNITSALNENGTKLLEDKSYWSSTLVTDDSQPYSEIAYCMSVKTKSIESANVETAKNVRPVKKIIL